MLANRQIFKALPVLSQIAAAKYLGLPEKQSKGLCRPLPDNLVFITMVKTQSSTSRSIMGQWHNCFKFSSEGPEKTSLYLVKHSCEELLKIDSLILDKLSIVFGMNYIIRSKFKEKKDADLNQMKVIEEIEKNQLENKWEIPLSPGSIFEYIRIVFQFLNASKVGFLRGDLHTLTFFELNKDLEEKLTTFEASHKRQEFYYQAKDFKALLYKITKVNQFRLPFKGIYKRQYQSKLNLYMRQLLLEQVTSEQSHLQFEEILDSLMRLNKVQQVQVVRKSMTEWIGPLTIAIREQQSKCLKKESDPHRKPYGKYLLQINPEKIATTAIAQLIICIFQEIYKQGSVDLFDLQLFEGIEEKKYLTRVLNSLESEIVFQRQEKAFKDCQKEYDSIIKKENLFHHKKKQPSQNMDMTQQTQKEEVNLKNWKSQEFKAVEKQLPYRYIAPMKRREFIQSLQAKMSRIRSGQQIFSENVREELGNFLIYILKEILTIENKYHYKVPLLLSEHRVVKKKNEFMTISIMRINEHFLSTIIPKLQKTEDIFIHMEKSLPTIIEPLPWLDPEIGGYYSVATTVMKYSNCPMQEKAIKFADNHRAFEVLNFLSKTPWKINSKVLAIVEQVWAEGGEQSCIPKRYSEMLNTYRNSLMMERDYQRRKELSKHIQSIRDEVSLRGDFNLKLNIARCFEKVDQFYFPHNFDFRGRVYPIPPNFNHIGNDLVRGLLLFGRGLRVGSQGLRWLKIHTANLMGKDKAPIDEKLVFIQQNLPRIHQMAEEPLKYRQWLSYEDCWQAIASIMDLSACLKSQSPQDYVSYLHVHQDGSCNGLQHYAALGRDSEGAAQVNLAPAQRPSDIYTHVSKMVIKMIEEDLKGPPADHHIIAQKLLGNIKRKTIKQTVMTSVYGVTFIGAREQIYRQLQAQNFMSEDENYAASIYVARLTLEAISNLFTGAHNIKQWFRKCASIVSKTGNPVGWITPLGLPVVQPYRKANKMDTITTLTHSMSISRNSENIPVDTNKQASAFPPNYVHSLDSSHMMYTSEQCRSEGIAFAAVHDSYWTHAATVDRMNVLLRQQFIRLHSEPLLQNFKKNLETQFPQIEFPPIPERGNFDLENIKKSLYFFS